jgi:hypothetical protein
VLHQSVPTSEVVESRDVRQEVVSVLLKSGEEWSHLCLTVEVHQAKTMWGLSYPFNGSVERSVQVPGRFTLTPKIPASLQLRDPSQEVIPGPRVTRENEVREWVVPDVFVIEVLFGFPFPCPLFDERREVLEPSRRCGHFFGMSVAQNLDSVQKAKDGIIGAVMEEGRKRVIGLWRRFSQACTCGRRTTCSEVRKEVHAVTSSSLQVFNGLRSSWRRLTSGSPRVGVGNEEDLGNHLFAEDVAKHPPD